MILEKYPGGARREAGAVFFALVWLSLASQAAKAAHPMIAEDTGTQGAGKYQLELTAESGDDDEDGVENRAAEYAATLSYGLADTVDVILGTPYSRVRVKELGMSAVTDSGYGDVGLDVKWRFYEQGNLSFALKSGLTVPTGDHDRGFGAGKATFSFWGIGTMVADPWTINFHAGLIQNSNDIGERESLYHASTALVYAHRDNLLAVADVSVARNADPASDTDVQSLTVGAIYSPTENLDFDIGYKYGLSQPETDSAILAGATVRF